MCNDTSTSIEEIANKCNPVLKVLDEALFYAKERPIAPGQLTVTARAIERAREAYCKKLETDEAIERRITELEKLLSLAEENERFHRANVEKYDDGSFNICWGDHEKGEECSYVRYYPESRIAELEMQLQQERVGRAEDVATLMRQIKLWALDYHKAEKRIAELEAQIPPTVHPIRVSSGTINTGFPYMAWTCPKCKRRKNIVAGEKNQIPVGDSFCSCGVRFDWDNTLIKKKNDVA